MLRWLRIHLVPSYKVDYSAHDLVLVVDTHPGSGTCRLPEGVVPNVVVDHHPTSGAAGEAMIQDVALPWMDPTFGATASMVGFLFVENRVPLDTRVATALVYGIKTDTQDLARAVGPLDQQVYRELMAISDARVVSRIERARLPQDYFVVLERGLRRAVVTDYCVTTHLGPVAHADSVAEMADLLFRLEGMKWAMAAGHNLEEGVLYLSIRSIQAEGVDAGLVAREISDGRGGGHESFAAAQIVLGEGGATPDETYERVQQRFLKVIRAKKSLSRPLTIPPDAGTP
jgi:nanoRNase/pAp phosphatase (c-di-AMP/oligoRNAs hydrolase)